MKHLNIEIKAKCKNPEFIRNVLKTKEADFKGEDHQIDTYFKIKNGRLKLREGNIENHLIYYLRKNKTGPKESEVILCKNKPNSNLKEILIQTLDTLVVVDKTREIYFINNIKFHIDKVKKLGSFVEIEAIDKNGTIGKNKLLKQCQKYLNMLKIPQKDLISNSYSDMLLNLK